MSTLDTSKIFEKINSVEPIWTGLCQVKSIYPEHAYLLLHAGPPFRSFEEIPIPVKNSLILAALFEGWADSKAEALGFIQQDQVKLLPAQDFDIVVPLAGVVSPSMYLIQIENANHPKERTFAVLNEGMIWCTRLGVYDEAIITHLKWLHGDFAHWLAQLMKHQRIALAPILQQSLKEGDDGHGRTTAASQRIADLILDLSDHSNIPERAEKFLFESLAFALNYWMAAALLILKSGQGSHDKALILRAGGNGIRFGYVLSTNSDQWIEIDAPEIKGHQNEALKDQIALGTLGDSAVVDLLGLGGQVLDLAEASAKNLIDFLPDDYQTRMHEFSLMPLDFLAQRPGLLDLDKVHTSNKAPLILLGMIDQSGQYGRIGGGVATLSREDFTLLEDC